MINNSINLLIHGCVLCTKLFSIRFSKIKVKVNLVNYYSANE